MGCLILPASQTYSQYYFYNSRFYETNLCWKIGIAGGMMNCLTDLGKQNEGWNKWKEVNWSLTKPVVAIYGSMLYNRWAGLTLQGSYGKVAGTDTWPQLNDAASGRWIRNLSFESTIAELALFGEVHPLEWLFPGRFADNILSPYFLAGAGVFAFNPVARSGNMVTRLAPLHTEGQGFKEYPERKPYALQQLNMVLGLGATLEVTAFLHLAAELMYRKLFTDYLDDVSKTYIDPAHFQSNLPENMAISARRLADRRYEVSPSVVLQPGDKRGNPDNKDAYFSFLLKAGMILGRERKRY